MSRPATLDRTTPSLPVTVQPRAYLMLALATVGFAVNFWAWALLSPLAIRLKGELSLTSFQQALLVAVPVVVGSLGRIPVGSLTDRYGGRVMFPVVTGLTIVPVLFLGLAGHSSYAAVLIGGFFLGIGGTAFAVGVPFVNAWFPPARRGFAIGVFGAGMGGTAISALTTVKLAKSHGISSPFLLTAAVLGVYVLVAAVLLRDAPGRHASPGSALERLGQTVRLRVTWELSALYAVAFGCYVALSVYLPTYLKTAYDLTQTDASNKMAGFVLVAVVMRPVGGWLCDRFTPTTVLAACFAVVTVGALVQSASPDLFPTGTTAAAVRCSLSSPAGPRPTRWAASRASWAQQAASAGSSRRC
jgi:NNP family nitrate/nitrite transporter-like MFS transporter